MFPKALYVTNMSIAWSFVEFVKIIFLMLEGDSPIYRPPSTYYGMPSLAL